MSTYYAHLRKVKKERPGLMYAERRRIASYRSKKDACDKLKAPSGVSNSKRKNPNPRKLASLGAKKRKRKG